MVRGLRGGDVLWMHGRLFCLFFAYVGTILVALLRSFATVSYGLDWVVYVG